MRRGVGGIREPSKNKGQEYTKDMSLRGVYFATKQSPVYLEILVVLHKNDSGFF